ncbi:hypothetical protein CDCA_CDCA01G0342 [Cyanidium caldarium]|uniref:Crossover junction endonuclease MUS81 n=1 Tax=Cyanidium caldarium TaxID=2771 RepID=A0AAV9IPX2_CYACA|nr:hypothetical protein CDCA_CDCA01G0342 [Cyanidium caldarium]
MLTQPPRGGEDEVQDERGEAGDHRLGKGSWEGYVSEARDRRPRRGSGASVNEITLGVQHIRTLPGATHDHAIVPASDSPIPTRRARTYRPREGSAASALLIALQQLGGGPCTRVQLLDVAQRYASEPIVRSGSLRGGMGRPWQARNQDTGHRRGHDYYDGWSCMNATLVAKGLVQASRSRPRQYTLSETGRTLAAELAQRLQPESEAGSCECEQVEDGPGDVERWVQPHGEARCGYSSRVRDTAECDNRRSSSPAMPLVGAPSPPLTNTSSGAHAPLMTRPQYPVEDVVLVIDQREKLEFQELLRRMAVTFQVRTLEAGDAVWLAQVRREDGHRPSTEERVLDTLVERKKVSDLLESIRDRRYQQQKARMRLSGMPCLVYLVEGAARRRPGADGQREARALRSALLHTQVRDGFHVVRTEHAVDTAHWYAAMTEAYRERYVGNAVTAPEDTSPDCGVGMEYGAWQARLRQQARQTTVRDIFQQQLQSVEGVGASTAQAIMQLSASDTPRQLYEFYRRETGNGTDTARLLSARRRSPPVATASVPRLRRSVAARIGQVFT